MLSVVNSHGPGLTEGMSDDTWVHKHAALVYPSTIYFFLVYPRLEFPLSVTVIACL